MNDQAWTVEPVDPADVETLRAAGVAVYPHTAGSGIEESIAELKDYGPEGCL